MLGPAQRYLSLRSLGVPAVLLSLATQGVFRGFKDTTTPLYATGNMTYLYYDQNFLSHNKPDDDDQLLFCINLFHSDWRCHKYNTRPDLHIRFSSRRYRSSHCSCPIPVSLVSHF